MRQVTIKAGQALKEHRPTTSGNTKVKAGSGLTEVNLYLHGNCIASYDYDDKTLWLSDCNWQTVTTKERLNGVLDTFNTGLYISQRKGEWFIHNRENEQVIPWNGTLTLNVNEV